MIRKIGMSLLLSFIFCCIFLLWFLILKFPLGFLQIDKYLGFFSGLLNLILTLLTIQIIAWISKSTLFGKKLGMTTRIQSDPEDQHGRSERK